jgi:uncharacterized membrane protein YphA (DoxX/SURF4 family)
MAHISGLACFFLVLLRLVIGWHFAVEGVHKLHTHQIGKTSTNTPWSSEPFFREGYGPAADWYRQMLGISDEPTLSRLRERDADVPVIVRNEWLPYLAKFSSHYALSGDQTAAIQAAFEPHRASMTAWLNGQEPSTISKPVAWGTAEVRQTLNERLADYESKKREVRDIQQSEQTAFNKDVDRTRLRALKVESARILNDIVAEVDRRTAEMKAAVITAAALTDEQKKAGPVPEPPSPPRPTEKIDKVTMWMQAILGGFLLVGLFTRLSSVALAGFLLQVVLIVPALPSASPPPGEMGHYLYVDMHVLEMVALLVLAAIPTGKWFGLDAIFTKTKVVRTPEQVRADHIRDSLRQSARTAF